MRFKIQLEIACVTMCAECDTIVAQLVVYITECVISIWWILTCLWPIPWPQIVNRGKRDVCT